MKRIAAVAATLGAVAHAATFQQTPMERVAVLLQQMRHRIEQDGKVEQQSYDKYACWCEDTMGRKANDIAKGKETIEESQALIIKLKAEIASHGAEIQQAKKDIAANMQAQEDATAMRNKENAEYVGEKTESEQCTGALEAAVKVLAGAGEKKGFLQTYHEAELLSVVMGIKQVLRRPSAAKLVSGTDLDLLRRFAQSPEDFVQGNTGMPSLAQIANNPFGDYAPQSTQIQGILKGMYDTFVGDLERSNADEAEAQKSHEELMATKTAELETLQATLQQHELDLAQKNQRLADTEQLLDDAKKQLDADEKLFENVKSGCQLKAEEWSERTQLRTEELSGVGKAIEILTSPDARKTFGAATTTFFQVSATPKRADLEQSVRSAQLANLAQRYHSMGLAQIAVAMRTSGHFDKVMASIDQMISDLRKEEQDDIQHRDRCQNAEGKNSNDVEDLNAAISKADQSIKRLQSESDALQGKITTLKQEISSTRTDMKELLDLRNEDVEELKQALKDDADAVVLLKQAEEALKQFYKNNGAKLGLLSKHAGKAGQEPVYSVDPDKAPETTWSGGKYGGKKDETTGVVAILQMIIEDVEKEMATARADDAKAQDRYEKERDSMQKTLDAQLAMKLTTEKELNEVESKMADSQELKDAKHSDLGAEQELKSALYRDCSWVSTHFESRRDKRKAEMAGLEEAKSYLSGVESGDVI